VGLADKSINEARERITVAMRAMNYEIIPTRILVNLSPAHIRKEGVQLDLAIAAALMVNFGYIDIHPEFLERFCLLGELSLTGEVKKISGILPLALEAQKNNFKYLIVPSHNQAEARLTTLVKELDTKIFQIASLSELQSLLEALFADTNNSTKLSEEQSNSIKQILERHSIKKLNRLVVKEKQSTETRINFSDVVGQHHAKRGLEIAAAGDHHLLMIGPPGCGKSMLAKRFKTIIPELDFREALESTKIHNISNLATEELILEPPFRSPHHSASTVSLVGGGANSKPGEVSLAHNGVLFLDELTEFNKHTIENLRQILEDGSITVTRVKQSYKYPARFTLISACNPCPCGFLGDTENNCYCTPIQISKYLGKLSGPLLDRIDIHLELSRLNPEEIKNITQANYKNIRSLSTSSEEIKSRVTKARQFAREVKPRLVLNKEAEEFMDHAVFNLKLSARSHQKILRVSRSIANLAESELVRAEDLAEALQFRNVNWEKYGR
jgi:magnesium chelatase family protein